MKLLGGAPVAWWREERRLGCRPFDVTPNRARYASFAAFKMFGGPRVLAIREAARFCRTHTCEGGFDSARARARVVIEAA